MAVGQVSVYGINKVCHRVVQDADFRAAMQADPEATLAATDLLDDEERLLLLRGDVAVLAERGAHTYLLANLMRTGVVGLTKDVYVRRMRDGESVDSNSTPN